MRATVVVLSPKGVLQLPLSQLRPETVGMKGYGLSLLPAAWVPPFFVVSSDFCQSLAQKPPTKNQELMLRRGLRRALKTSGITVSELLVRSNCIAESAFERGRYETRPSNTKTLLDDIVELSRHLHRESQGAPIAVIVQRHIQRLLSGHLSNARRFAEEYRDAQVQFEDTAGFITEERLTHRAWRRGREYSVDPLVCRSESELRQSLREPLAWSVAQELRFHFEWVWDGSFLHVVQADRIEDTQSDATPATRKSRPPQLDAKDLRHFRVVTHPLTGAGGKLRKHSTYASAGFWQPKMYVLDDRALLESAANGRLPDMFMEDLTTLTARPLVLRTSSNSKEEQLLPRSQQLTSANFAADWLRKSLLDLRSSRGNLDGLSIVGHHYIPAKVAAFSSGSIDRLDVSIEALWGMPEGLYYYPYDSFTVTTTGPPPESLSSDDLSRYKTLKRKRWKSHFVAPDREGRFVCNRLGAPWDWRLTIDNDLYLKKIAAFTRFLAKREKRPLVLMWLIDCSTEDGIVDLVPWYHEGSADPSPSFQFHRNARDEIIRISTEADLEKLEARPIESNPAASLVVELSPIEDQAIRSESFAKRVGTAANRLDAIISLNGASLSHIYYILARTGARVIVRNSSDYEPKEELFSKLVRDRIPEKVAAGGEVARFTRLSKEEITAALKIKLVEEAYEARDARPESLAEEIADLYEVLESLAKSSGISTHEIEKVKASKRAKRGGFDKGLMLISTSPTSGEITGESLFGTTADKIRGSLKTGPHPLESTVRVSTDTRDRPELFELVESVRISLTQREWRLSSNRRIPEIHKTDSTQLEWSIEALREGADLRLRLKIRLGHLQLELPLETSTSGP